MIYKNRGKKTKFRIFYNYNTNLLKRREETRINYSHIKNLLFFKS